MRPVRAVGLTGSLPVMAACAHPAVRGGTLASLHQVRPDTKEMPVDQGLDRAVQSYRDFLQQAPDSTLAPEAMRRLADLKIEKEFGIHGDGKPVGLPASGIPPPNAAPQLALPRGMDGDRARAGPLEAIKLYDQLLAKYPQYASRDQVLYQKARAYDELGQPEEAMRVMEQLFSANPHSLFTDELQFRRAERFFVAKKYREAESSYAAIADGGRGSGGARAPPHQPGGTVLQKQLYPHGARPYLAPLR